MAGIFLSTSPALCQKVGTAGAVNPAATGTPPGGITETINIGADVVFQERISTTESGAVQVLFVDRTALTVGPNSDVTVDEFVYNPDAGTGSFVATLAKGSLRFVGGQISRNSGATIKTESATIGIRGSVVRVTSFANQLSVANFQGNVQVNLPSGQSYTLPQGQQLDVNFATGTPTATTGPVAAGDTTGAPQESPPPAEEGAGQEPEEQAAEGPPPFVPDAIDDVYTQDPQPESPPSPPEPDPDPPPPPPEP